ncbi:MAG: MATE family efflux transporter [Lachnospiraceae bacterium]|nr:MATE family efflux transporter [Lachnospiraceae bacterium]
MLKDKKFYHSFFAMWIVLVLQNVITLSVNLADNMMLGAYSEVSLSGVAAVNQIQFIYQYLLLAIGEGVVIMGSQYFGKKKLDPIRSLSGFAMRCSLILALVLFLVVSLFPQFVLSAFTTDAAIITEGTRYLMVVRWTYFFFAVSQILLAILRSTGYVNMALYLSVLALGINVCGNYAFIYGKFGFPEMGVAGAGLSTLIARIAETAVVVIYMLTKEKHLHMKFRDFLKRIDPMLRNDYVRVLIPMLIINALWGFNNAAQNAILGHMTARAIAANSVATTLFLMVKSTGQGSASAASFIIGHAIGEGRSEKELKHTAKTLQLLFLGIGILSGLLLFFIRIPILSIYNLSAETKAMANQFLIILSVVCVGMSYQMPTNAGIIRGGGDTKYCMVLDLISIWAIVMPLSFILAFVVKASPIAVVWCLNADQIFKGLPAFIKCNYGHWAKKLTRD